MSAGLLGDQDGVAIGSVEESNDPDAQKLDFAGMVLFGAGLFPGLGVDRRPMVTVVGVAQPSSS